MNDIPLEKVKSYAPIVIYDEAKQEVISEHESTPDAVQALAKYAKMAYEQPAIFRKSRSAWVRY